MDSDRRVAGLAGKMGTSGLDVLSSGGKDESRSGRGLFQFLLALCALLLIVGTEPFKVLLRKNIGKFALGIWSLLIAVVAYGVIAWLLYSLYDKSLFENSSESFLFLSGAMFYFILAIGVLICGVQEYFKANRDDYRGDSVFFGFLIIKGVDQKTIWTVIEPLACISVSSLLILLHPYIGLPVLITSVSFLCNELYKVQRMPEIQKDNIARMNVLNKEIQSSFQSNDEFNKVRSN